jgi:hypothetical protein
VELVTGQSIADSPNLGVSSASGLLEASGEQFSPPLGEPVSHVSDHAGICAVLGERGVGDLGQCSESVGEQQPVEAAVRFGGEFQQLLA